MKLIKIEKIWFEYHKQYEALLQKYWEKYFAIPNENGEYKKFTKYFDYKIRVEIGFAEEFIVNMRYDGTRESFRLWKGETEKYILPKPLTAIQTEEQWKWLIASVENIIAEDDKNAIPF